MQTFSRLIAPEVFSRKDPVQRYFYSAMNFLLHRGACLFLCLSCLSAVAAGKAEHVVVVVWDGMRPDFITPQYTPTLYAIAREGVFFKNHHAVFVSSTEVNGTAIATGVYPDRSGIMANSDYRPEIGYSGAVGTESLDAVRRGDLLSSGHYLPVPTVAEILQRAGHPTIIAGTKAVALLHDRAIKRTSKTASNSVNLFKGRTLPSSALPAIVKANERDFPTNVTHPNTAQDAWTTKALTHTLWKKGVPKYTLLWLSDPDASQHETSPGSDVSLAGIENSDKNLAEVIKALDEKKVLAQTDIMIVSDHGFSSVQRTRSVSESLRKLKFVAGSKLEDPEPGDVITVGLGGSTMLYVIDDDEAVMRRLVDFLQTTDYAGVIFSRIPMEGTFPINQMRIGTTNAPDIIVSLRWTADKNEWGAPGMILSDGGKKGGGTHASLSHFDMNNTLVAMGPDFKRGMINDLPSGNADIAPTVLAILGVKPPQPMDGRVLTEALLDFDGDVPKPEHKTIEASRDLPLVRWHQYLKYTTMGKSIYFDEGNGGPVRK